MHRAATVRISRTPPCWDDPKAANAFEALARTEIASRATRESPRLSATGRMSTCPHDCGRDSRVLFRSRTLSTSGSIPRMCPDGPTLEAAANVKSPMFAPTSHTDDPGRTKMLTARSRLGSTLPRFQRQYLSPPPSGETNNRSEPNSRGKVLVSTTFRLSRSAIRRRSNIAKVPQLGANDLLVLCTRHSGP